MKLAPKDFGGAMMKRTFKMEGNSNAIILRQ